MPRKSAISRVSCGWALPENTFRSPSPVDINPSPPSGLLILPVPVDVPRAPNGNPAHARPAFAATAAAARRAGLHALRACSGAQAWLGRKDSNLRIRDPKSRALPLGHAPPHRFLYGSGRLGAVQTLSVDETSCREQGNTAGQAPPDGHKRTPLPRVAMGRARRSYSPRPSDSVSNTCQPEPFSRPTAATASRPF